jgi:hypothetical protein
MIPLVGRHLAVGLFLLTIPLPCAGQADDGCDALQSKYNSVAGAAAHTPVQRVNAYLHLLAATPDDPTDCITTKIMHQIEDLEKTLVVLEIDGRRIKPDWVLGCHSVDLRNGACQGAELDASASLPEKGEGARLREKVRRSAVAVLRFESGYQASVVGAFGDSGMGLKPLKMEGTRLMVGKLERETEHPSVTVILRRNDGLKFRKVVWHLYPLESLAAK